MKQFDVVREKVLAEYIIMIDGFSGSGKSFLMPLISHLQRGELWQISMGTERICILEYLKKIDKNAAISLVKMAFDERLYDLQISRNVNFRAFDDSSVQKNLLFDKYNRRMLDPAEKAPIVKYIEEEKPILTVDVHYLFGYSDVYFRGLFEQMLLYIQMVRNPAHLISAYFKQNIHQRILTDKMELTLCVKIDGYTVPYYALEFYEDYLQANDLEKTILFLYSHSKKVQCMLSNLNEIEKSKFFLIPFENITVNPDKYLNTICLVTKQKKGSEFDKIYKHLNLPRQSQNIDFNIIKKLQHDEQINIQPKYNKMLDELIEDYKVILKRY